MKVVITAVNLLSRVAMLGNGESRPITNLINDEREETDDADDCIKAVVVKVEDRCWASVDIGSYLPARDGWLIDPAYREAVRN